MTFTFHNQLVERRKSSFVLFLIILISCIDNAVYGWLTPCPVGGYKLCSSSDLPETVSTATTISNCVYDGCPQVLVNGASLTLNSVTFKNSIPADSGSALNIQGSSSRLTISNSNFINCQSTNQGGAIYAISNTPYSISISNTNFINCTAENQGGAICLSGSISITTSNTNFINTFAQNGGGIMAATGNSIINGGRCVNAGSVVLGGCFYFSGSGNVIRGVSATGGTGDGSFLTVNSQPANTVIQDCLILNSRVPLYGYGGSAANAANNVISVSNVTYDTFGPQGNFGLVQDATLICDRLTFTNGARTGNINAYNLIITNSYLMSSIQGYNVTIKNSLLEYSEVSSSPFAYLVSLTLDTVTIRNFKAPEALIYIQSTGYPVYTIFLQNVLIENNHFLTIDEGIAQFPIDSAYHILNTGGIIYARNFSHSHTMNILIGSNVTIRNNKFDGFGAVFYIDDVANITFLSDANDLNIYNNVAARTLGVDYLAIINRPNSYILGNLKGSRNKITGAVYMTLSESAIAVMNSPALLNVLPPTAYYTGPASYITITTPSNMQSQTTSLYLSQSIPTIKVTVNDYFGGVAALDLSKFVIVNVAESLQGKPLAGETIKGVFSSASNPLTFQLAIKNLSPGNYTLTFNAINTSPLISQAGTSISANLTFLECNPITEIYVPEANNCYALSPLSKTPVQVIGGLASFCLFGLVVILSTSIWVKRTAFTNTEAHWYAFTLVIGSALCAISFLPQFNRNSSQGCMAFEWLYNLGFILVAFSAFNRAVQLSSQYSKMAEVGKSNTKSGTATGAKKFAITDISSTGKSGESKAKSEVAQ